MSKTKKISPFVEGANRRAGAAAALRGDLSRAGSLANERCMAAYTAGFITRDLADGDVGYIKVGDRYWRAPHKGTTPKKSGAHLYTFAQFKKTIADSFDLVAIEGSTLADSVARGNSPTSSTVSTETMRDRLHTGGTGEVEELTSAVDFINKAAEYVGGSREETHGSKGVCFTNMAVADTFLDDLRAHSINPPILPVESALRMVLYKIARIYSGKYNPDDFIDIAGYAGCAGEVAALAEKRRLDAVSD